MSNSFESSFQFGNAGSARQLDPQEPMRIVVMGNFSGCGDADGSVAERKFRRVDIDNFEDVLQTIAPKASVQIGDSADAVIEIGIGELDDFHPDALYRNVPIFHELRQLRKRLTDPKSFSDAAAELNQTLALRTESGSEDTARVTPAASDASPATAEESAADESDADTLDRVLGQTVQSVDTSAARSPQVDIQSLINQIVAPYIEPKPDPRQDEYVGHADAAIAGQMRAILHDGSFQALESAWLGLNFLVSQVAQSEEVQVFLWDVTKAELLQAGESESEQLEDSLLFRRLVTDREQVPFTMLVSTETFSHELNDLILLTRLGAIGANCGGPALAAASPQLVGSQAWTDEIPKPTAEASRGEQDWQSIRTSAAARWIGLAGPRLLLRLPYGASTSPVDAFDFEEIDDPIADHESLLWGASSVFVATLLATSYLQSGWQMTPGDLQEIADLPALTYKDEDGEVHLKACAEVFLSERVAEQILDHGVMPLMSFKNRNAARVLRVQSVSSPASALAGPWS
ncbi:type VI secretion system contractile sheath domain-containing protein [Rhodopirellula sp. JC639]|uniref:type VI secretion system contractile sheath domain-containing protein n=1 Tax=Stieleria mannarensis TaxID=2755585 RepID=UPI0015FFCAE9|nr:type VI secretion system contractile sheath large subunit [Rhodopirellula sp. JC639]